MSDNTILEKIETIEKELMELKLLVLQNEKKKIPIKLKGVLEGVEISEDDINSSKRSLFRMSTDV